MVNSINKSLQKLIFRLLVWKFCLNKFILSLFFDLISCLASILSGLQDFLSNTLGIELGFQNVFSVKKKNTDGESVFYENSINL